MDFVKMVLLKLLSSVGLLNVAVLLGSVSINIAPVIVDYGWLWVQDRTLWAWDAGTYLK